MSQNEFTPWLLQWTPEHVERFWNWFGTHRTKTHTYFSKRVGDAILDAAAREHALAAPACDYGAGPGHLVEKLLARKIPTVAVDTSPDSVRALEDRLGGNPHFRGAQVCRESRTQLADGAVATTFLVEIVEHLADEILHATLSEIRRITRQGGHLVVTTPNEEDLTEHHVLCPSCGCVFHSIQHVRSFTAESLSQMMSQHGFEEIRCTPTVFSFYPKILHPLHRLKYRLWEERLPHLLYIGRRL